jgi:DNA-directed RNA polymerase subunit RPC12/RpoP
MAKVKCEFCGAEYEDPESIFCDNCGRKMERVMPASRDEEADYVRCNLCGWKNKKGARICVNCGEGIHQRRI